MSRAAGLEGREETVVPKSKKQSRKTETAEDVQKLYARTYGSRLARQVGEVGPGYSRRATIVASLHRLNNESAAGQPHHVLGSGVQVQPWLGPCGGSLDPCFSESVSRIVDAVDRAI
jgi:hypothetical protein